MQPLRRRMPKTSATWRREFSTATNRAPCLFSLPAGHYLRIRRARQNQSIEFHFVVVVVQCYTTSLDKAFNEKEISFSSSACYYASLVVFSSLPLTFSRDRRIEERKNTHTRRAVRGIACFFPFASKCRSHTWRFQSIDVTSELWAGEAIEARRPSRSSSPSGGCLPDDAATLFDRVIDQDGWAKLFKMNECGQCV